MGFLNFTLDKEVLCNEVEKEGVTLVNSIGLLEVLEVFWVVLIALRNDG